MGNKKNSQSLMLSTNRTGPVFVTRQNDITKLLETLNSHPSTSLLFISRAFLMPPLLEIYVTLLALWKKMVFLLLLSPLLCIEVFFSLLRTLACLIVLTCIFFSHLLFQCHYRLTCRLETSNVIFI